ncbi:MAG TPA: acyl-CoA dehydrogenase family protein, partial [Methylomirabilota bacterium]|nr:acyl-CoA dehydrogenase family protein [Methylomirabilota bacterium]
MNTTPQEPEVAHIDTSKMSAGQRAAMELTEAARERTKESSFVAELFMGRFDRARLLPFPGQSTEDHDQGDAFLERLDKTLHEQVDPDAIDRTGEIPDQVIASLASIGAFGIKVPAQYGGLGLSQTNYCRAAM